MNNSKQVTAIKVAKKTQQNYEEMLNGFPIPESDKRSNGGRIPDRAKYGTWMRRADPIAFQVGYGEWCRQED